MTSIAFNTLQASRKLRDAGVDERTAEAIVEVVSQTTDLPDMSKLATKADLDVLRREFGDQLRQQLVTMITITLGGTTAIVTSSWFRSRLRQSGPALT
jgi:hypothetical protein